MLSFPPMFARVARAAFWIVAVLWASVFALALTATAATRYEDSAPQWTYAGGAGSGGAWTADTCSGYSPSGGNCTYDNTTNATATFSLTDVDTVTLGYCRDTYGGDMIVKVDGATVATIDTYSGSTSCTASSPFSIGAGTHSFVVTVAGTHNASSADYYVTIDYLDVTPIVPIGPCGSPGDCTTDDVVARLDALIDLFHNASAFGMIVAQLLTGGAVLAVAFLFASIRR